MDKATAVKREKVTLRTDVRIEGKVKRKGEVVTVDANLAAMLVGCEQARRGGDAELKVAGDDKPKDSTPAGGGGGAKGKAT
jgi:hypothetical protein